MENCVIYARFSSYGQNEQSIEAQVRICKEFAESKGLKCVNIYSDKARTGTNDDRPGFQRMIKDSQIGAFKYIIVYMFDRFARNRRDSIMYKEMLKEKYSIKVMSALEPIAEDEGGEFYEMFLDWNAEKYSKRLSKRVKDGLDTSVANGTFCGGVLIYGYKIEYEPIPGKPGKSVKRVVINEDEANIVRYAFEQYGKGVLKRKIAQDLNEQGLRLNGKEFIGKSFDRLFYNKKYTGEFNFGDRPCNNMYPSIVSKELYEKVQERLHRNRYFAGGISNGKIPYSLTGKCFCGDCGTEMISDGGTSHMKIQYHYYICKNRKASKCKKLREDKDSLELNVTKHVVAFLSDKANAETAINNSIKYYDTRTDEKHIKSIRAQIAQINKEVEEQTEAFVKAKSDLLQDAIEKKMGEYKILLDNLKYQEAQLELERGYRVTKEDLLAFLEILLQGDVNDKDYQQYLIDNLVFQVFVWDKDTLTYLNLKMTNKDLERVSLEDAKEAIKNSSKVQGLIPPARH